MIFLIHYSRSLSQLVSITPFDDSEAERASCAKLDLEISLLDSDGTNEVVLLQASSESDLRRTHGRYFGSIAELRSAEKTTGDNQPKQKVEAKPASSKPAKG